MTIVNIKDKEGAKETTGEMVGGSGEMGTLVGEMLTEPAKLIDFGFSQEVVDRANSIKTALEDDKPEIAIVRVEEGWSGSRRLWPAREIDRIVSQTNELHPVGHLGHIRDDGEATDMPEPQTTWIGAVAKTEVSKAKDRVGEMVRVAYFAGYNLPGAKIRSIIKAQAVRGISWWGHAHQVPIPGKGVEMREFDLKALDWARKLAEGMPTSGIVAIAREMKESDMAELDLAQVTPEQFKKDNPNGYALLRREVEDEHKGTVGEMQKKVDEGEAAKTLIGQVCEALGIEDGDKLLDNVKALKAKVGERAKGLLDSGLAAILAEKVPGDDEDDAVKEKRALLGRLLPVGEMESKVAECKSDEDAKKLIGEMVDEAMSKDGIIKSVIGEMQPPVVRRREELQGSRGSLDNNTYVGERSRVTVS